MSHGLSTRYLRTGPTSRASQAAYAAQRAAGAFAVERDPLTTAAQTEGFHVGRRGRDGRRFVANACLGFGQHGQAWLDNESSLLLLLVERRACPTHGERR